MFSDYIFYDGLLKEVGADFEIADGNKQLGSSIVYFSMFRFRFCRLHA